MGQNIIAYKKLQEINATTFHEIKFSDDVYGEVFLYKEDIVLMDKNFDEQREYGHKEKVELQIAWMELYDEYFKKSDNPRLVKELKNKREGVNLLSNISLIKKSLEALRCIEENEKYIDNEVLLKEPFEIFKQLKRRVNVINYNVENTLKQNNDKLQDVLGGLETRYEIVFKEQKEIKKADIQDYWNYRAYMEENLDKNMPLYINMAQWVSYEIRNRLKIKKYAEQHSRTQGNGKNRRTMG